MQNKKRSGHRKTIENELAAAHLLQKALAQDSDISLDEIKFSSWVNIEIRLRGDRFHGSITVEEMAELQEFQRSLYRAYMQAVHGNENISKLTDEERSRLLISFQVSEGCSLIQIDAGEWLEKFIAEVGPKMTGEHLVKIALIIAITYFGVSAIRAFVNKKSRDKELEMNLEKDRQAHDQERFLREKDIEVMKIVAEATGKDSELAGIAKAALSSNNSLLRMLRNAETGSVGDLEIEGEEAQYWVKNQRQTSTLQTYHSDCTIVGMKRLQNGDYLLTFKTVKSGAEFKAKLLGEGMSINARNSISSSILSSKPISLSFTGRVKGNNLLNGIIKDATDVPSTENVHQILGDKSPL